MVRDPIQRAAEGTRDLYDVATWDPRSRLDRLAVFLYGGLLSSARVVVVLLALLIVGVQLAFSGVAVVDEPAIAAYILLSTVPALLLAGYVYRVDVTIHEPLVLLVGTFLLGFALAGFAAVFNTLLQDVFSYVGAPLVLYFFLVVGPIEETVKLLAVRLYAFRSSKFDAVVDGAVYGAMAGLGFATIENAIYITDQYVVSLGVQASTPLVQTLWTAAVRSFAGPGHVIYSAFAGYYLGLAKFNPDDAGPIVVKGLLVAVALHATYNSLVSNLSGIAAVVGLGGVPDGVLFVGFILLYDGLAGYALYRKLARYRETYFDVGADRTGEADAVDRTEFERGLQ